MRWLVRIAGVLAAVALVGLRNINQSSLDASEAADTALPLANEPESYVVPPAIIQARIISPPIRLTNYLVQHGSYASMLTRTSVQANVVSIHEPEVAADETRPAGDSQ